MRQAFSEGFCMRGFALFFILYATVLAVVAMYCGQVMAAASQIGR
jgi:hypothetical protein